MNYENHDSIVAAISIFTQQEFHILGNPALLHTSKKASKSPNCRFTNNNITLNEVDGKEMTGSIYRCLLCVKLYVKFVSIMEHAPSI